MSKVQRTRMVVRLASLILSLFFVWGVVDYFRAGNVHPLNIPFQTLLIAAAVACIAAWRWERAGGLAVIVCGLALGVTTSLTIALGSTLGGNPMPVQALAGLVWALPFVIFGLLFRAVANASPQP